MTAKDIGYAVQLMKEGKRVTRPGWNGKNMWICLMHPETSSVEITPQMTLPFVYMRTMQGDLVPWLCSQTDLLAEDWEEA